MSENQEIPFSPAEIDWYIDRFPYTGNILMSAFKDGLIVRSQVDRILQMVRSPDREMRALGANLLEQLNAHRYWGPGSSTKYYNKTGL